MGTHRVALRLWLSICSFMMACGGGPSMEVELDAFSGRPNPKWTLSEELSSRLLGQIASLPEAKDAPQLPDLGFRGFLLRSGDSSMRVFGGRVVIESARPKKIYRDTRGILEELVRDARRRSFGAIVGDSNPK